MATAMLLRPEEEKMFEGQIKVESMIWQSTNSEDVSCNEKFPSLLMIYVNECN